MNASRWNLVLVVLSLTAVAACRYEVDPSSESSEMASIAPDPVTVAKDVPAQGCRDPRDGSVIGFRKAAESKHVGELCYFGNPLRKGQAVRTEPLAGWGRFCIAPERESVLKRSYLQKAGEICWLPSQYGRVRGKIFEACPQNLWLCRNQ
jgi:hypothetical protein